MCTMMCDICLCVYGVYVLVCIGCLCVDPKIVFFSGSVMLFVSATQYYVTNYESILANSERFVKWPSYFAVITSGEWCDVVSVM